MKKKKRVVIIGAGFGGLASACILAKNGYKVTLLEKNATLGGRARVWKEKGFSFDLGPSWYLMPEVFEHFFALFDKKPEDYYTLTQLDPSYQVIFGPNERIELSKNLKENMKLFDTLEQNGAKKLTEYLKDSALKYEISMKEFVYKDFSSIFSFFNKRMLTDGRKLRVFDSMQKHVDKYFNADRAKKILMYNIVFLGGSPTNTPSIYSIISHVDFNLGVWYPMGGFSAVVDGLEKLARELGVEIKTKANVKKIHLNRSGLAEKVITDKNEYETDIVLANADYQFVETKLLDKKHQSYPLTYWKKKTVAPSAFIIYLGLNKKINNLIHHNLFLANDWVNHFNEIFKKPDWPKEPSYYVSAPSKTDPSVAPKDGENLFILVPVASGIKDTEKIREQYYQKIITDLETQIGQKITDSIVLKRIFTINDFKNDYNAFQGTALGLTHTMMQTAIFRPKNKSQKVKNLYYTGQYTIPGIGVPMVLISAEVTSNKIIKEHEI